MTIPSDFIEVEILPEFYRRTHDKDKEFLYKIDQGAIYFKSNVHSMWLPSACTLYTIRNISYYEKLTDQQVEQWMNSQK